MGLTSERQLQQLVKKKLSVSRCRSEVAKEENIFLEIGMSTIEDGG